MNVLLGFFTIAIGVLFIYTKYRIVIGGKKIEGKIVGARGSSGTAKYTGISLVKSYRFEFTDEGRMKQLEGWGMVLYSKKFIQEKRIGQVKKIYFNPKHQDMVILVPSIWAEICGAIMIAFGIYLLSLSGVA